MRAEAQNQTLTGLFSRCGARGGSQEGRMVPTHHPHCGQKAARDLQACSAPAAPVRSVSGNSITTSISVVLRMACKPTGNIWKYLGNFLYCLPFFSDDAIPGTCARCLNSNHVCPLAGAKTNLWDQLPNSKGTPGPSELQVSPAHHHLQAATSHRSHLLAPLPHSTANTPALLTPSSIPHLL